MKNELALFIAIIVSCVILFMSTIIKGNIISTQANNNNSGSSVISAAANKTAVEAQSADAFYEQYWTCNKAFHC